MLKVKTRFIFSNPLLSHILVSLHVIFRIRHYVMIGNHQREYEDAKEIGNEAQVLIINHSEEQRYKKLGYDNYAL